MSKEAIRIVKCKSCNRKLEHTETFFHRNKQRKSGLNSTCRDCTSAIAKERRKRQKEAKAEAVAIDPKNDMEAYLRPNRKPMTDQDGLYIPSILPHGAEDDAFEKVRDNYKNALTSLDD